MSCNQLLASWIVVASIFVIIIIHDAPSVALVPPRSSFRSTSYTHNSYHHRNHGIHILQLAPQQLGEFEAISFANDEDGRPITRDQRRVWLYDFVTSKAQQETSADEQIPYQEAWDMQKKLVDYQLARIGKRPRDPPFYDQFVPMNLDNDNAQPLVGCDSIIMLQHNPVYTLGTASDPSFIHGYDDIESSDINDGDIIPIVRIERGGEVTYHGPGQLTVYPILDLRGYKQDIHWYMRALEEVILLALEKSGVKGATREDNLTGVWVSDKKIAAIGIKARRWVTMHGLAINVDVRSLQNFQGIVPCGLEGRAVTCINDEIDGESIPPFTVETFAKHVKEALEEIFGISLVSAQ